MINESYTEQLLRKLVNEHKVLLPEELTQLKQLFDTYEGRVFIESKMQQEWQADPLYGAAIDFDKLYEKINWLLNGQKRQKRVMYILRQCAAALFIPLLGLSIFLLTKPFTLETRLEASTFEKAEIFEQEYYIPAGTKAKLILPDSTKVWLNSGSRLIVENAFGEKSRKVRLSGEAYFEVQRNKELPFVVQTYDMDLKVLGTAFNISAYPDDQSVEAVLVQGSIEVNTNRSTGRKVGNIKMEPAQKLALNKSNKKLTVESNIKPELYTAWKDNLLIYQDTPMEEVAKSLERWFNVVVLLKGGELKSYTYTGKFEDRSLGQILTFIQLSSPISYNMKKDTVLLSYR